MKTVVQPYDEEVDVTVLEVDMPEPELLEQKTGSPEVTPEDWEKVKPIYTDFMQSYTSHPEQPVEQWLGGKLQEYLPEEPSEEIHKMTDEIVTTLHRNEAMHQPCKKLLPMAAAGRAGLPRRPRNQFRQCRRRKPRSIWLGWIRRWIQLTSSFTTLLTPRPVCPARTRIWTGILRNSTMHRLLT